MRGRRAAAGRRAVATAQCAAHRAALAQPPPAAGRSAQPRAARRTATASASAPRCSRTACQAGRSRPPRRAGAAPGRNRTAADHGRSSACRSPATSTARAAPTRWPRGVLDGIDDPAYLSLRQTLLQERAALDALGADPRVQAIARLDAFAQSVTAPAGRDAITRDPRAPWWQRAFGNLLRGAAERSRRGRAGRRSRRRAGGTAAGNFAGARRRRTPRRERLSRRAAPRRRLAAAAVRRIRPR